MALLRLNIFMFTHFMQCTPQPTRVTDCGMWLSEKARRALVGANKCAQGILNKDQNLGHLLAGMRWGKLTWSGLCTLWKARYRKSGWTLFSCCLVIRWKQRWSTHHHAKNVFFCLIKASALSAKRWAEYLPLASQATESWSSTEIEEKLSCWCPPGLVGRSPAWQVMWMAS